MELHTYLELLLVYSRMRSTLKANNYYLKLFET